MTPSPPAPSEHPRVERLPAVLVWLIQRVVPVRAAQTVLTDLEDEYAAVCAARAPFGARWWLAKESASLLAAYLAAPLTRVKGWIPMGLRDLHLVIRGLRRRPVAAFGAAAMLSSGLLAVLVTAGLSATLLFRPVSRVHGDRLQRIAAVDRQGRTAFRLSHPELQVVRERVGDAATLTSVNLQPVLLRTGHASLQTMAEVVDGNYFSITGMTTLVGRGLLAADDRAGAPPVVVIAEPLWRDRFGASPTVLGESIALNGAAVHHRRRRRRAGIEQLPRRQRRRLGRHGARRSGAQSRLAHGCDQPLVHQLRAARGERRGSRRASRGRRRRPRATVSRALARTASADGARHGARRRPAHDGHHARGHPRRVRAPHPRGGRGQCRRPAAGARRGGSTPRRDPPVARLRAWRGRPATDRRRRGARVSPAAATRWACTSGRARGSRRSRCCRRSRSG